MSHCRVAVVTVGECSNRRNQAIHVAMPDADPTVKALDRIIDVALDRPDIYYGETHRKITVQLAGALNRPQFTRHSPAVLKNVSRTLPAIKADPKLGGAGRGMRKILSKTQNFADA